MLDSKAVWGMQNATPEKRYKSFLNTVTDLEKVWFLSTEAGYATFDVDGIIHVLIWPREEFSKLIMSPDEKTESMEIHDFLQNCKSLDDSIRFMVFPTEKDSYVVTAAQLCADIEEHLEELE